MVLTHSCVVASFSSPDPGLFLKLGEGSACTQHFPYFPGTWLFCSFAQLPPLRRAVPHGWGLHRLTRPPVCSP